MTQIPADSLVTIHWKLWLDAQHEIALMINKLMDLEKACDHLLLGRYVNGESIQDKNAFIADMATDISQFLNSPVTEDRLNANLVAHLNNKQSTISCPKCGKFTYQDCGFGSHSCFSCSWTEAE